MKFFSLYENICSCDIISMNIYYNNDMATHVATVFIFC